MRPAKIFLGLLLAAAVLITFLKILLFFVMAALIMGTLFFAGRAFWWLGGRGSRRSAYLYGDSGNWFADRSFQGRYAAVEPLDPRARQRFEPLGFARKIEVAS